MPQFGPFLSRPGQGGGGLLLRTPPDEFTHANRAGAEAARDAAITNVPAQLAEFTANPNLAIILTVTGADPDVTVYQVRRGNAWADATGTVRGPAGADGDDAALLEMQTFAATSDGVQVGDATTWKSATGDFDAVWYLTEAAPRNGFTLPPGRRLTAIYWDGIESSDLYESSDSRRYVANDDGGEGSVQHLIRTAPVV